MTGMPANSHLLYFKRLMINPIMEEESSFNWATFVTNLQTVIDEIEVGEAKSNIPVEFSYTAYWKQLGDIIKAVSHETTKISLAYSKQPFPSDKDCESLLISMEKTILALVHIFSNFPKSAGMTLRRMVKIAVLQVLESVRALSETIKNFDAGSTQQWQNTGIVWEESDNFSKLPQDNKSAGMMVIEKIVPLIDDAHCELIEALNSNDDDDGLDEFLGISNSKSQNDHHWTESDKNMIQFCLGLIKCSKLLLKRTKSVLSMNGNCDTMEMTQQIDDLVEHVERLSPAVDDLASSVYPPVRLEVIHEKSLQLHRINKDVLDFIRLSHMTSEDDQKWLEFLTKANNHNFFKINTFISPS